MGNPPFKVPGLLLGLVGGGQEILGQSALLLDPLAVRRRFPFHHVASAAESVAV